jgi:hypothetical protein
MYQTALGLSGLVGALVLLSGLLLGSVIAVQVLLAWALEALPYDRRPHPDQLRWPATRTASAIKKRCR